MYTFSQDCAAVNTLAMETLDAIYLCAEDWPCFPHTLELYHVGPGLNILKLKY